MQAAIITPVHLLPTYGNVSSFHMALTHLIENSVPYADFYHSRGHMGDYVVVDNSLIELGSATSVHRTFDAAMMICANEIILPDVFLDANKTITAVNHALSELARKSDGIGTFKLMAVAQGKNLSEWLWCYKQLAAIKEIDVIGIPKVTNTYYPDIRVGRAELVCTQAQHFDRSKQHHLLGVWDDPIEVDIIGRSYPGLIRSVDTCLPIQAARKGIAFLPNGMAVKRPEGAFDFFSNTDPLPMITEHNISTFLRWCK